MHMPNDTNPYGRGLAEQIAQLLRQAEGIYHVHRDYCGMGLWFDKGAYYYGPVHEGYPTGEITFATELAFVHWLAQQSDESLCGRETGNDWLIDNQRITRARLEAALRAAGITPFPCSFT